MCSINASLRKHRMRTKYNNIAKANLTYRTFFIHQLIQYLSGGGKVWCFTASFFIDRETQAKCISHNRHPIISYITFVYFIVSKISGRYA